MTKRRLTPQEKKVLSYAKDCPNVYGENDKSSRKAIPRRKQQQRQNERRVLKANLKKTIEGTEEVTLERPKLGMWRKVADEPLGSRISLRRGIPKIGRDRKMSSDLQKEAQARLKKAKRWTRKDEVENLD